MTLSPLLDADGGQRVSRCVGECVADENAIHRVAHGDSEVLVWVGIYHGHPTQLQISQGKVNVETMMRF